MNTSHGGPYAVVLQDLQHIFSGHAEALVAYGDPAEEIAKIARDRKTGLIVVGLHGSPLLGPRMGSVTYRVLCLAPGAIVALPPRETATPAKGEETAAARTVTVI